MMKTAEELAKIIKKNPIFLNLDNEIILSLLANCKIVTLKNSEILFYQGDKPDSVYLVISGKLSATLDNTNSKNRDLKLGLIKEGEVVGELGVLSNQPRSLTIRATEDSELLYIPAEIFKKLFTTYASVCAATTLPIIQRSISTIKLAGKKSFAKHMAVIPADNNLPLENIYGQLQTELEKFTKICIFNELYLPSSSTQITEQIETAQQKNDLIIYLTKSYNSPLAIRALDRLDKTYILAGKNTGFYLYELILKELTLLQSKKKFISELIWFEDEKSKHTIASFINLSTYNLYHKIKNSDSASYRKLARFMAGRITALVFSGGGVRNWASVGAIKAIKELGINIDIVGGTSSGSLVGALFAMGLSYEEIHSRFKKLINDSRSTMSWKNLGWPSVSLLDGKDVTKALHKNFGELHIEDLPIPFFCTSCNLALNKVVIHNSGSLFEKTRASISIPGLVPPVVIDGQMHVDGSILKDLPVDTMKNILSFTKNKVIAILISATMGAIDQKKYYFPYKLSWFQGLLHKLGIGKKKYIFPDPINDYFMRTVGLGGNSSVAANAMLADILIELDLQTFPLLEVNDEQITQLINIGYEVTLAKLRDSKQDILEYQ